MKLTSIICNIKIIQKLKYCSVKTASSIILSKSGKATNLKLAWSSSVYGPEQRPLWTENGNIQTFKSFNIFIQGEENLLIN